MKRLIINRTNVNPTTGAVLYDANGTPLGEGSYYIKDNPNVFEKDVNFRPITTASRYFIFNAKENKYEGETTYVFSKWNDELEKYIKNEPLDNKGTIRLGRPDADQLKLLSQIEQDFWRKKVRWQLCVFGLAYFKGGSYKGELVEFNYSGKTGLDLSETLGKFKRPWYKTLFNLGLEKQGDIIKPNIRKIMSDKDVEQDVLDAVEETYKYMEFVNSKIEETHRAAMDARSGVAQAESSKPKNKAKSTELDNEIPF